MSGLVGALAAVGVLVVILIAGVAAVDDDPCGIGGVPLLVIFVAAFYFGWTGALWR
jgi:hypothetical protein